MKIAVYGISYQQSSMAGTWLEHLREADSIHLLDLSPDLREAQTFIKGGACVTHSPLGDADGSLRAPGFDQLRNQLLESIPGDFDVCIALDPHETLSPDWRQILERIPFKGPTMVRCPFSVKWTVNGDALLQAKFAARIHSRRGFKWAKWFAEKLTATEKKETVISSALEMKRRAGQPYHPAIACFPFERFLAVEPGDAHCELWYAEYLMHHGNYGRAAERLKKYFLLNTSEGPSGEKAFAFRLLGQCLKKLGASPDEYASCFFSGAAEAPWERETWAFLALEMAKLGNWPVCYSSTLQALKNAESLKSFLIEPPVWEGLLEHLREVSEKNLGIGATNADGRKHGGLSP